MPKENKKTNSIIDFFAGFSGLIFLAVVFGCLYFICNKANEYHLSKTLGIIYSIIAFIVICGYSFNLYNKIKSRHHNIVTDLMFLLVFLVICTIFRTYAWSISNDANIASISIEEFYNALGTFKLNNINSLSANKDNVFIHYIII